MRRFGLLIFIVAALLGLAYGGWVLLNQSMRPPAADEATTATAAPAGTPGPAAQTASVGDPRAMFDGLFDRSKINTFGAEWVQFTGGELTFSTGATYQTEAVGVVAPAAAIALNGPSFAEALDLPAATLVEVRRISAETLPGNEPAGGLCQPGPASFVAIGYGPGPQGSPEVSIVAFRGTVAPGPESPSAELCPPAARFARPL
jgi:hypothetical protein